jgi:hypothetical protein
VPHAGRFGGQDHRPDRIALEAAPPVTHRDPVVLRRSKSHDLNPPASAALSTGEQYSLAGNPTVPGGSYVERSRTDHRGLTR